MFLGLQLTDGATVILIDPAKTGRPFKDVCHKRGFRTLSIYTVDHEILNAQDRLYQEGDSRSLWTQSVDEAIRALGDCQPIAVIPTTEPAVEFADHLADALGLPGNSVSTSRARRDKAAMRCHAAASGLRSPEFRLAQCHDVPDAAKDLGYPVIVKPLRGAGANSVTVLEDESTAPHLPDYDIFGVRNDTWLVEQYVRGDEFAINTFSEDGRHRVLDIWKYAQPTSRAYDQPYWNLLCLEKGSAECGGFEEFASDVLTSFGVSLGPSHIELKVAEDGIHLIEIGSRLPGAHMPDQWRLSTNIEPYDDTLSAFCGETSGLLDRLLVSSGSLGICCINSEVGPGILRRVVGVEEVSTLPEVSATYITVEPGDFISPTRDLGSVIGYVLVNAPEAAARAGVMEAVHQLVRLELV